MGPTVQVRVHGVRRYLISPWQCSTTETTPLTTSKNRLLMHSAAGTPEVNAALSSDSMDEGGDHPLSRSFSPLVGASGSAPRVEVC